MNSKLIKTGLAALTFFVMLLSLPGQFWAASNETTSDVTLTIGNVEGRAGEVIEVPVTINNLKKDIAAYGMEMNYDRDALEVVSIKKNYGSESETDFWSNFDNSSGFLRAAWVDTSGGDHPIKNDTKLFSVQFSIKKSGKSGEKSLVVASKDKEKLNFTDSANHALSVKVNEGKLTVSKSNNANLSSLSISDGALSPAFHKDITQYTTTVEHNVHSIAFVPAVEDANASIQINSKKVNSGTKSPSFNLQTNENLFSVDVVAQNGTKKTYQVTVIRKGEVTPQPDSNTEKIESNIEANNGSVLSKVPIYRTTDSNGTIKDQVTLSEEFVRDIIENAKKQGTKVAKIVIPDEKDKVSEVYFTVPKNAVQLLHGAGINLEIMTNNVHLKIPKDSIKDFKEDLYFRLVPVKTDQEKQQIEDRAKKEDVVKKIANDRIVNILGRPMEIQTNLQSRQVTVVLPLDNKVLTDLKKQDKDLQHLYVFIEHHDGTKELVKGKLVSFGNKKQTGLEFTIDKFSTFTPVYLQGTVDSEKETGKENNKQTGVLPKTGSNSSLNTYTNIAIGVLLMMISAMWFVKKRKVKENS